MGTLDRAPFSQYEVWFGCQPLTARSEQDILGLHFPVASINVRHARSVERALRVAEIKLMRLYGEDWRVRADAVAVEPSESTPSS